MDTGKIIAEDSFEYDGPLALTVDGVSGADGGADGDVMTMGDSTPTKTAKDFLERERSAAEKQKCRDILNEQNSPENPNELKKEIERQIALEKYTGGKSTSLETLIDEYRTSLTQGLGNLMDTVGTGINYGINYALNHIGLSMSTTLMFEGQTLSNGLYQKTASLDLFGGSIDIAIGHQPTPQEIVSEMSIGLSEHLGVGFYCSEFNAYGDCLKGGIAIHAGLGLGSPIGISGTFPDPTPPRTSLGHLDLRYEQD